MSDGAKITLGEQIFQNKQFAATFFIVVYVKLATVQIEIKQNQSKKFPLIYNFELKLFKSSASREKIDARKQRLEKYFSS